MSKETDDEIKKAIEDIKGIVAALQPEKEETMKTGCEIIHCSEWNGIKCRDPLSICRMRSMDAALAETEADWQLKYDLLQQDEVGKTR